MTQPYEFDLIRIFFGDFSWLLLLEIVLRTVILYSYAMFLFRLAPRRNLGQMTQLEVLLIIALGSAMGDPMFYPDVPLLHGMLVITLVIGMHHVLISLTRFGDFFEGWIEGDPIRLVADGLLDLGGLKRATMTREDVFMQLRMGGFSHLGEIRRAYIETNGRVAILAYQDEPRAGLTLTPPRDIDDFQNYKQGDTVPTGNDYACYRDGRVMHLRKGEAFPPCPSCRHDTWVTYVISPQSAGDPAPYANGDTGQEALDRTQ